MTRISDRHRAESTDIIGGMAWGAIKDWQRIDGRPRLTATVVYDAAAKYMDDIMFDADDLIDVGVKAVLASLGRSAAAIHLDEF